MKKLTYIYLSILILFSCDATDELNNKKIKEQELFENKKETIISEITNKYQIKYCFDTISYIYTINYDKVIETNFQLIKNFQIIDIYKKENQNFITVNCGMYPSFYFDLIIKENELNKILNDNDSEYEYYNNSLIVVKINEIQKIKLGIISYPDDESNCSIEIDSYNDFIVKGEIIDFIKID